MHHEDYRVDTISTLVILKGVLAQLSYVYIHEKGFDNLESKSNPIAFAIEHILRPTSVLKVTMS